MTCCALGRQGASCETARAIIFGFSRHQSEGNSKRFGLCQHRHHHDDNHHHHHHHQTSTAKCACCGSQQSRRHNQCCCKACVNTVLKQWRSCLTCRTVPRLTRCRVYFSLMDNCTVNMIYDCRLVQTFSNYNFLFYAMWTLSYFCCYWWNYSVLKELFWLHSAR